MLSQYIYIYIYIYIITSVTTSIVATFAPAVQIVFMPNGTRTPYRIISGRSPSPAHSSDSEDTANEKCEYHAIKKYEHAIKKYEHAARSMRALPRLVREHEFGPIIFSFLTNQTRPASTLQRLHASAQLPDVSGESLQSLD